MFPDTQSSTSWQHVIDGHDGAQIASGIVTMRGRIRIEYAGVDPTPADAPTHVSELINSFQYDPEAKKPWVEEPTTAT
jgi:hypothetical protein